MEGKGRINTRLIPGYTTGHRSAASSLGLAQLDLKERACLQVLSLNKTTSIISPPAVFANINCVVYTRLSPNKDEANSHCNKNLTKTFTYLSGTIAGPIAPLCYLEKQDINVVEEMQHRKAISLNILH